MSKTTELTLECPNCHNHHPYTLHTSVNVTLNPSLRDKVFDGTLFLFTCENCKSKTVVDAPCLYNDMSRNFMVYKLLPENEDEFVKSSSLSPRLRKVTSYNGFIEKISIFEHELNDFCIELLKLKTYLLAKDDENMRPKIIRPYGSPFDIYFAYQKENKDLVFEVYNNGELTLSVSYTETNYLQMLADFEDMFPEEIGFISVDLEWALAVFKDKQ